MQILGVPEPSDLRNYLKVEAAQFEKTVTSFTQKEDTILRQSIRLVVMLVYGHRKL